MDIVSLVNKIFSLVNFILKHLGDILLFAILIFAIYYAYKFYKWFKKRMIKESERKLQTI